MTPSSAAEDEVRAASTSAMRAAGSRSFSAFVLLVFTLMYSASFSRTSFSYGTGDVMSPWLTATGGLTCLALLVWSSSSDTWLLRGLFLSLCYSVSLMLNFCKCWLMSVGRFRCTRFLS